MTWATERRLDYIDWVLIRRGTISRRDLVEQFGVSLNQATTDLAAFRAAHPDALRYDGSVKRYVTAGRYRSHRRLTRGVLGALDILAATGHPMAWALPPGEDIDSMAGAYGRTADAVWAHHLRRARRAGLSATALAAELGEPRETIRTAARRLGLRLVPAGAGGPHAKIDWEAECPRIVGQGESHRGAAKRLGVHESSVRYALRRYAP